MARGGANFSSEELVRVLSHYEIGIIQQVKPLIAGNMRAAKVVIVSDKGKYLAKRRPKGKDDLYRVTFSHSVQTHLSKKAFPVSVLVPTRDDNNTILNIQNHIYELFEFITGNRYPGSAEAAFDAGGKLAKFHLDLSDFASDWKPLRETFHDASAVRGHLKTIGSEKSSINSTKELRKTAEALMVHYNKSSVRVNELGFDNWDEQIVHGDWHPGNMLFLYDKIVAVLDFDSVKIAPTVTDLANGMLQFSIVGGRPNPADWPDYLDQKKLAEFLDGYRQTLDLDQYQQAALLDLMIETIIAEAVLPIAATGFFGNLSGVDFLKMIHRKCDWIENNRKTLLKTITQ